MSLRPQVDQKGRPLPAGSNVWLRIGQFALDGIEGNVPWTFHVDGIELHVRHLFSLFKSIILGHFVILKR